MATYLERWQAAGIVDAATADRIREYEAEASCDAGGPGPGLERPGLVEGLVYVGFLIVAVGVMVLVGTNWDALGAAGRIIVTGLPGAAALGAGVWLRRSDVASLRRGAGVAWLVGGGLIVLCAGVTAHELFGWGTRGNTTAAAAAAVPLAVALWWLQRVPAQVVGLAAAAVLSAIAAEAHEPFGPDGVAAGLTLAAFGLAWMFAIELWRFEPRQVARPLAAIGVAAGAFFVGIDGEGPRELFLFAAVAFLISTSVSEGSAAYMVVGVAALFFGVVNVISRHVDNETVAAFLFIGLGLALLAGVVIMVRRRPWTLIRRGGRTGRGADVARSP